MLKPQKNCKICIKNTVLGNIGHAEHAQACPGCPPLDKHNFETQFYYFATKKFEITIANNMDACY